MLPKKTQGLDSQGRGKGYQGERVKAVREIVKEKKFPLKIVLYAAKMSKSTYYSVLKRIDFDEKNKELIAKICEIFYKNKKNYGVRRVHHELLNQGYKVNHKKVHRIMKKLGLKGKRPKQKYHSYQGTIGPVAENTINRNFSAEAPNLKWTTDVSQFSFSWGKCYLSPMLDMFNSEIVGRDLSMKADYSQIERMLDSIDFKNRNINNLTIHSDQGWQYQNPRFVNFLKARGIRQSMSRKGNCYDNSIMESFFGIMKNEIYYGKENNIQSFDQFKSIVRNYIYYYNNIRIKEKTEWKAPIPYRNLMVQLSV